MEWQLATTALIVVLAAGYVCRRAWRALRSGSTGCGGGCECPAGKVKASGDGLIPLEQIKVRKR